MKGGLAPAAKVTRRQWFSRGDAIITPSHQVKRIDHCFRLALKAAYRIMRVFRFGFRPSVDKNTINLISCESR